MINKNCIPNSWWDLFWPPANGYRYQVLAIPIYPYREVLPITVPVNTDKYNYYNYCHNSNLYSPKPKNTELLRQRSTISITAYRDPHPPSDHAMGQEQKP